MRRWVFAWAWFIAAVLVMGGAKGCSESEQCQAARAAMQAVCSSAPESVSCASAKQAAEEACKPAPTPTPTPAPTPPPAPTPVPPPAAGCSIDGEPGPLIPGYRDVLGPEVNAAMHVLRPDCDPGGRCVLEEGRQSWQARVIAELRRRGVCAGQHEPGTDEVAVATSATAPREGWHIFAGDDTSGTIVWSPQAARPAYAAPDAIPPQPPPPTSPPGDCPALPCPASVWTAETLPSGWGSDMIGKAAWAWSCHERGRLWEDCTPIVVRQEPYCRAIGMSPMADGSLRAACPMRPDGHPEREVIELWLLGGAPVPDARGGQDCNPEGRPAFAVPRGSGDCRICSADEATCSEWF